MKMQRKITALMLALSLLLFSGCSSVKITTDLNSRLLAACGSTVLSLPEFTFILMDCQNRYNLYYSGLGMKDFWAAETGEGTVSDQVKNSELKQEVCILLLLNQLAREKGISLTAQEKDCCREAAKNYIDGLSEPELFFTGGDESALTRLYEKYGLAQKVIGQLSSSVNDEISDNDKRVILLQVISCDTKEKAEEAQKRIAAGESFKLVAEEYSTLQIVDYQVTRGVLNPVLEEKAFHMSDGEISDIIGTDEAFYLLKCVNDFDRSLSETYEESTLDGIRYTIWSQELAEYADNHKVSLSNGLWEHIEFSETTAMKTTDLYANFRHYWKKQK